MLLQARCCADCASGHHVQICVAGTMLCGLCILCCGRVRMSSKEGTPMTALYVNIMVGTAQLFTVTFMLVGWFWSFTWGIYMVILAGVYVVILAGVYMVIPAGAYLNVGNLHGHISRCVNGHTSRCVHGHTSRCLP